MTCATAAIAVTAVTLPLIDITTRPHGVRFIRVPATRVVTLRSHGESSLAWSVMAMPLDQAVPA